MNKKARILFSALVLIGFSSAAQDTSRRKEVRITSTFKPVLKEAAKINFNATPQVTDTARPRLQYSLPNQNLLFGFQPGSLRPLALQVDSLGRWSNESYVKAGFGSLKTPFLQAGLSLGDGKTAGLNLYAKHVSSNGKRPYQDFTNSSMDVHGFFQTAKSLEWNARFGGFQERYNKYGFQPAELKFPEDSIQVRYQTWRGRVGFRNINRTEMGLSYAPEVRIEIFGDGLSNTESNTLVHVPVQKRVGKNFAVDVSIDASLSRYKPEDRAVVNNNYVSVAPSVLYKSPNIQVNAGLKPSWDNGDFKLFPNVMAEFSSSDKRISFQLGWIGYLRNSGFQYSARYNPWIWAPDSVYNTRIEERYAGFKGSAGDHFTYSAKVGFHRYNNQPLYTNDTSLAGGGKSFMVIREPQMNVLHFGGELGYTVGEKFSVTSGLTFNQYNTLQVNKRAWGLLPLEFTTNLRVQVLRDLYVTTDLYAFDGPRYLKRDGDDGNLQGGMDLSAGLEFRIVKNIKLWAQFNNIFNKEYQRWNQYPVYGFNFLGGVVFSFAQNNK